MANREIDHLVDLLNFKLDRPLAYATKHHDGTITHHEGHIFASSFNPGDYARYSLMVLHADTSQSYFGTYRTFKAHDMKLYLLGILDALDFTYKERKAGERALRILANQAARESDDAR